MRRRSAAMRRAVRAWPVFVGLTAALLAAAWWSGPASAAPSRQAAPEGPVTVDSKRFCLACHQTPGRLLRLPSGEWLGLTVDPAVLDASVHAGTSCAGCHTLQSTLPHRAVPESRRSLMLTVSAACAQCHQEEHEGYEEGIHGVSQALGVSRAASCVDCHAGHAVSPVDQWSESEKSARCAACHTGANSEFAVSGVGHDEADLAMLVERFLVVLTALVLGFGFLHVELDALRWVAEAWRGRGGGRRGR